jgi:hypothetical protein
MLSKNTSWHNIRKGDCSEIKIIWQINTKILKNKELWQKK